MKPSRRQAWSWWFKKRFCRHRGRQTSAAFPVYECHHGDAPGRTWHEHRGYCDYAKNCPERKP